ncbi:MAG TPA: hypothetical protein VEF04_04305 [Blastocatellia bacterium]|nr:hypothetical protein [Blastocatellia bacterium]
MKLLKYMLCIIFFILVSSKEIPALLKSQNISYDENMQKLLSTLRNESLRKNSPQEVIKAIKRLGELRSTEAVDDLIKLLTFRQSFNWEDHSGESINEIQPIHTGNRYPATSALINIGKPALPALVKIIQAQPSQSLASENAIFTIKMIFRDNPLGGVEYLKQASISATSTQAKQRLNNAVKMLEKVAIKQN